MGKMVKRALLFLMLWFVSSFSNTIMALCINPNESLFEVRYNFTVQELQDKDLISFQWKVSTSDYSTTLARFSLQDQFEYNDAIDYTIFQTDVSLCVPDADCLVFSGQDLPPQNVRVLYQERELAMFSKTIQRWGYDSLISNNYYAAEIGNCQPVCQPNESLFEIRAFVPFSQGGFSDDREYYPSEWILQTSNGTTIMDCLATSSPEFSPQSSDCWVRTPGLFHVTRVCLERSECYRWLIVDIASIDDYHRHASINVTFDGLKIATLESPIMQEAIEFGSSCIMCEDSSSRLEVFLLRRDATLDASFVVTDEVSSAVVRREEILKLDPQTIEELQAGSTGDNLIHYFHECVPTTACLRFEATTSQAMDTNGLLRVRLGGLLYADSVRLPSQIIFGQCTAEVVCSSEETLALIAVNRAARSRPGEPHLDYVSWRLDDEFYKGSHFRAIVANYSYRQLFCVPNAPCHSFEFDPGTFIYYENKTALHYGDFQYSVFLDGDQALAIDTSVEGNMADGIKPLHKFGSFCGLSQGALAGVVVAGCTVFAVVTSLTVYVVLRRRRQT